MPCEAASSNPQHIIRQLQKTKSNRNIEIEIEQEKVGEKNKFQSKGLKFIFFYYKML